MDGFRPRPSEYQIGENLAYSTTRVIQVVFYFFQRFDWKFDFSSGPLLQTEALMGD